MTLDVLARSAVLVGQTAPDLDAAIGQVGAILVAEGLVEPSYVDEMRARETIISTYLGNGIALPHGTNEARDAVRRTGLAVVQYPGGVRWGEGTAHLVIGLAATSDEHIAILSRLAAILDDAALCRRLGRTKDADEIHAALTAPSPEEDDAPVGERADDVSSAIIVTNPAGLHARPAAEIVARVRAFESEITIVAAGRRADARSITGLLGLGAAVGDEVVVIARGSDARQAIDAVAAIVTDEGGS